MTAVDYLLARVSAAGARFFISKGNLCGTVKFSILIISFFCPKPLNDLLMLLEKAKFLKLHVV